MCIHIPVPSKDKILKQLGLSMKMYQIILDSFFSQDEICLMKEAKVEFLGQL